MTDIGFTRFETAIGRCGIAWSEAGITGVHLPDISPAETGADLARRFAGAEERSPTIEIQRAIDGIRALLRGEAAELSGIALDLSAIPAFHRRIYAVVRAIPAGATLTYGEIATRLGEPAAARAVGQAMGANPFPILMPCHRVLAANGEPGGFSAPGGVATKLLLLAIEGAIEAQGPFQTSPVPAEAGGLFDAATVMPGFDPIRAENHLRRVDPVLDRLIDLVGPLRLQLDRRSSLFGALAEAIVYQQLTTKAAATIFGRVKALFPRSLDGPSPEQILRVPDDKLRGAGLSQAKVLALRDLAARAAAGVIPTLAELRDMSDEAIIERLITVRGIGRWTVEMLLIFRLGRPDVLPADDYGLRKAYAMTFGTTAPTARELLIFGEIWRPFRSAASWYLWRALDR
jgi:methylated-DNA-[protein]-cysteine S-methyltransferase